MSHLKFLQGIWWWRWTQKELIDLELLMLFFGIDFVFVLFQKKKFSLKPQNNKQTLLALNKKMNRKPTTGPCPGKQKTATPSHSSSHARDARSVLEHSLSPIRFFYGPLEA